jgi:excisionase family DNA binding protein
MDKFSRRRHNFTAQPLWVGADEVAVLLGVHRSTVWRWLEQGLIPEPCRVGGRTLWPLADVELFARCRSVAEFRRRKSRPDSSPDH